METMAEYREVDEAAYKAQVAALVAAASSELSSRVDEPASSMAEYMEVSGPTAAAPSSQAATVIDRDGAADTCLVPPHEEDSAIPSARDEVGTTPPNDTVGPGSTMTSDDNDW